MEAGAGGNSTILVVVVVVGGVQELNFGPNLGWRAESSWQISLVWVKSIIFA